MNRFLRLYLFFCVLPVLLSGCSAPEEKENGETIVPVEVNAVRRGEFVETLHYFGDIRGRNQVDVYPKVSGKLKSYEAEEGDAVDKDEVIALIDRDVTGYKYPFAPVKSPISGSVVKIFLDEGDDVSTRSVLAVIADIEEVIIRISVSERNFPSIERGQTARIKIDAYPDKEFTGEVTRVSRMISTATKTAVAEVSIPNADALLIPGMSARIEIVTGERNALLTVPDSIVRRPGTASYYCFIVKNGKVRRTPVEIGARQGANLEVLSGLEEGDLVVTSGQGMLETGTPVEIIGGK